METRVGVNSDIWRPDDKVDSEVVEQCLQARPQGLRRGGRFVRRRQKLAENAAQREKGHLWMETS
jgi:hypothetical protein